MTLKYRVEYKKKWKIITGHGIGLREKHGIPYRIRW